MFQNTKTTLLIVFIALVALIALMFYLYTADGEMVMMKPSRYSNRIFIAQESIDVLINENDFEQAHEYNEKLREWDERFIYYYYNDARILLKQGKSEEARYSINIFLNSVNNCATVKKLNKNKEHIDYCIKAIQKAQKISLQLKENVRNRKIRTEGKEK